MRTNAASNTREKHVKPLTKGWKSRLKTCIAQATTPGERKVFRDALKVKGTGHFPEHVNLVPLNRELRGTQAWWAKRR